jgi:putative ABC transport system ATP-binding protein
MLHLDTINVWFGEHHVLRNLSCQVEPGDFITIVGTNGAGKSTFFDTIAGKIHPQQGRIMLDRQDITRLSEQQRAGMITRIFQNTELNSVGSLTVAQNLALARYSRRPARFVNGMQGLPRHKAEALMQSIGLNATILDKRMQDLSGGQRQLIAFVMATEQIPKILLLDEPTAALDPQAATRLLQHAGNFIKEHAITTLLITHDPYIALSMGNKVWVLERGVITKQYAAHEKQSLNPHELIGNIDYAALARLSSASGL